MDLDPLNTFVALGFEYTLGYQDYLQLRKDYTEFFIRERDKATAAAAANRNYKSRGLYDLLQNDHAKYFKVSKNPLLTTITLRL